MGLERNAAKSAPKSQGDRKNGCVFGSWISKVQLSITPVSTAMIITCKTRSYKACVDTLGCVAEGLSSFL